MPVTFKLRKAAGTEVELFAETKDELLQEALDHFEATIEEEVTPTVYDGIKYTHPDHIQFIQDMDSAGYDIRYYEGRGGYCGPAVRVDSIQEIWGLTSVSISWDDMGRGVIAYPTRGDRKLRA